MTEQHVVTEQSRRLDQAVAATLRASAYCSFALASLGLVLEFLRRGHADDVLRAAVIFLLVTPALRIAVMVVLFFRQRDKKYALIAFAVLAILIGSAMLGINLE
jgi:uncharacterized membrane protein